MGAEKFGERFREITKDVKLADFSRKSGIGDNTLRNYLKGALPRLDNLISIAETAGVNLLWLATGEGAMRPAGKADKIDFATRLIELQNDFPQFEITAKVKPQEKKQAQA